MSNNTTQQGTQESKRRKQKEKEKWEEDDREESEGNRNDNFYGLVELIIIMNWLYSVLQRTAVWFLQENCLSVKKKRQ